MNRLHLVFVLVALTLGQAGYSKGISFPGRDNCLSPGKSWKIICQENKGHEGAYKLLLLNSKSGANNLLFDGGRWCEVLWQKDESHVAITDWGGSNFSEILIKDPQQAGLAKSLRDVINMEAIKAIVRPEESRGHCYWEALNWEPDGQLRFRIYGHTDTAHSREFSHIFLVKLSTGAVTPVSGQKSKSGGS